LSFEFLNQPKGVVADWDGSLGSLQEAVLLGCIPVVSLRSTIGCDPSGMRFVTFNDLGH
jgi:hypothetical protein